MVIKIQSPPLKVNGYDIGVSNQGYVYTCRNCKQILLKDDVEGMAAHTAKHLDRSGLNYPPLLTVFVQEDSPEVPRIVLKYFLGEDNQLLARIINLREPKPEIKEFPSVKLAQPTWWDESWTGVNSIPNVWESYEQVQIQSPDAAYESDYPDLIVGWSWQGDIDYVFLKTLGRKFEFGGITYVETERQSLRYHYQFYKPWLPEQLLVKDKTRPTYHSYTAARNPLFNQVIISYKGMGLDGQFYYSLNDLEGVLRERFSKNSFEWQNHYWTEAQLDAAVAGETC